MFLHVYQTTIKITDSVQWWVKMITWLSHYTIQLYNILLACTVPSIHPSSITVTSIMISPEKELYNNVINNNTLHIATDIKRVVSFQILNFRNTCIHRGVEIVSQLPDILAYFQFTGHSLDVSDNVLHDWVFPYHCI